MESNFNKIFIQFNNNQNNGINNKSLDESVIQLNQSLDYLHCGKCGANFGSIDGFICHKLIDESFDIYYEQIYINGNSIQIPKLCQKDVKQFANNNECDYNFLRANNSKSEKSDEEKSEETNEIKTNLLSNQNESEMRKEETKHNPIVTIIIGEQNDRQFYNCNDCKKKFTQKCRALRHLESEHDFDFNSLKLTNKSIDNNCDNNNDSNSCGEQSVPQSMKRVKCDKCGAHVKGKRALKVHQLTHSEERNFSCPYESCSFMFKTKGSMQRHIRRHTNERPFKCDLCGRNFRESGALTRHLKSRYVCVNKSDSDLPNYGKSRALPLIDSKPTKK